VDLTTGRHPAAAVRPLYQVEQDWLSEHGPASPPDGSDPKRLCPPDPALFRAGDVPPEAAKGFTAALPS